MSVIFVNDGYDQIIARIAYLLGVDPAASGLLPPDTLQIGSGNFPGGPTLTDSHLYGLEQSTSTTVQVFEEFFPNDTIRWTGTFTISWSGTLTEIGLFQSASSVLYIHAYPVGIVVNSGDVLQLSIQVRFVNA